MRIVSLLPSATEILYAVGAGDDVVGVTFECDEPIHARETAAIVSTSSLPMARDGYQPTPAEIDAAVSEKLAAGEDLYHLDRDALLQLNADLIVTQDLCAVCAVDVSEVHDALDFLGCTAEVLTTDPHTVEEILASIERIGAQTGHTQGATDLVASLRERLAALPGAPTNNAARVAVLEWSDPPFAPGHWVPEMVEIAGALSVIGDAGEKSVRTTWDAIVASRPEIIVVAPCGFELPTSVALTEELLAGKLGTILDRWDGEGPQVWAVDANASYARPGPRIVDGIEALAAISDPTTFGQPDPVIAKRCR
ncbi:cobalamin-binding protein [Ornithinimicrobium sp. Arc0846-15]|nr:cobalamin-binding protein [Ornithinimicrobium laminariae]